MSGAGEMVTDLLQALEDSLAKAKAEAAKKIHAECERSEADPDITINGGGHRVVSYRCPTCGQMRPVG